MCKYSCGYNKQNANPYNYLCNLELHHYFNYCTGLYCIVALLMDTIVSWSLVWFYLKLVFMHLLCYLVGGYGVLLVRCNACHFERLFLLVWASFQRNWQHSLLFWTYHWKENAFVRTCTVANITCTCISPIVLLQWDDNHVVHIMLTKMVEMIYSLIPYTERNNTYLIVTGTINNPSISLCVQ